MIILFEGNIFRDRLSRSFD